MRVRLPKHRGHKDDGIAVSSDGPEIGVIQLEALSTVFSRRAGFVTSVGLPGCSSESSRSSPGDLAARHDLHDLARGCRGNRRSSRDAACRKAFDAHAAPAAAVIVLLGFVALGVFIVVIVIGGITGQEGRSEARGAAADKAQGWLTSAGVDKSGASSANSSVKSDVPSIISTLAKGVIDGIRGLTSVIFGLSLAVLSLFFLLKDGPSLRAWVDRHLGLPEPIARTITGGVITSLRGYFRGVTIVSAFNGVVVGIGALLLGVPLAGTIAVVTFVTAYIPYLGAVVAGAFAVVIALGASGTTTALLMLLIVLLANGLLQNLVQPFAKGSALQLNPLVVLVVTIAGGCIFGTIGLILAAPLLSAAVHITASLGRARAEAAAQADGAAVTPPLPDPSSAAV